MNLNSYLAPYRKTSLRWITDLNVNTKSTEFLEYSLEHKDIHKRLFSYTRGRQEYSRQTLKLTILSYLK